MLLAGTGWPWQWQPLWDISGQDVLTSQGPVGMRQSRDLLLRASLWQMGSFCGFRGQGWAEASALDASLPSALAPPQPVLRCPSSPLPSPAGSQAAGDPEQGWGRLRAWPRQRRPRA